MYKVKKILFTVILFLLLISFTTFVSATNITSTNEDITTGDMVTVFELVDRTSCTIDLGTIGRFEKKVANFDATERSITIELNLTNIAEKQEDVIQPSELFLVIDNSNSMVENNVESGITRKQAVLDSARELVNNLYSEYPDLQVGVVSFSSTDGSEGTLADANLEQSLTTDQSAVETALSNIEAQSGIRTNIEAGLTIAQNNFSSEDNNKILVLLSDGVPNNDIHGNFSTYSGEVAQNTKAKLEEIDANGIYIIGSMIGLNGTAIEPSTQRTYQSLAEEIFGTNENPTVGQFFYIPDSEIESTIKDVIYDTLVPSTETKLRNVVIKDYFPQEIVDNFNFEYVASPNIGNVSTEIDRSDNSITWTIEVLNEGEVASLQYKLILKDDFDIEIVDKILPTNENIDITYNDGEHVSSDDSPSVRVKIETPPSKEENNVINNVEINTPINNTPDNTIAKAPIPQTGINNFITIAIIIVSAIAAITYTVYIIKYKNK